MSSEADEMKEILQDFITEAQEALDGLDQQFVRLETEPDNDDLLNEIFRAIHSLKGSAGFLQLNHLVEVAHAGENLLNKLRQHEMKVTKPIIDVILECVDTVKSLMSTIRETGKDEGVPIATTVAHLQACLDNSHPAGAHKETEGETIPSPKLGEILVHDGSITQEQVDEALLKQEQKVPLGQILVQEHVVGEEEVQRALKKQGKDVSEGEAATLRVETKRLDQVMTLVGEMVLGRNRLMKLIGTLEGRYETDPTVRETAQTLQQINLVTADLQLAVMKTRMLPIKKVVAKFPRMVRDLASKTAKQVELEISGEETELDKSVIEEIGNPLVHLLRNSIDHGIETPEDRVAAGKPSHGTIFIGAAQEGNSIVITVRDNGRGMNPEKIRAKAIAKGLVTAQEASTWDRAAILSLIFQPGFSTAEQVTDISGRGVGMDVVRTNIAKLNGTIDLDTTEGIGTTTTIRLPLTVAIIQALLVGVGTQMFAVPLASVVEAVKLKTGDVETVGGHEVMKLRDSILPLLRLTQEFGITSDHQDVNQGYVVVVTIGERRVGIIVDRLQSQEEVVIKTLSDSLGTIQGIAGATITGEGKVILILDMSELLTGTRAGTVDPRTLSGAF